MKAEIRIESELLSDDELVCRARDGDTAAFTALSERYMPTLRTRANRYARVIAGDVEDFLQEGMLALFRAVKCYDEDEKAQFRTYAITCINNSMSAVIKLHMKNSHQNTNIYIDSIDEQTLYKEAPVYPQVSTVEDICIDMETARFRTKQIETLLSNYEMHVLRLYLKGYSYQQISHVLSTDTKAVDNALQRVRRKLRPEM